MSQQSSVSLGLHEHYFTGATQTLTINAGDTLFAAVYLDPASVPGEIMLQWDNGSWEHRAYWGDSFITYGANATPGSYYMGPLPAPGTWTLLNVPASAVGLEKSTISGMAFSVFNGGANWDYAGDASTDLATAPSTAPTSPTTHYDFNHESAGRCGDSLLRGLMPLRGKFHQLSAGLDIGGR